METSDGPQLEGHLSTLIGALAEGIVVVDLQGVHLLVNDAFCEMVQLSREELVGSGTPHPYWPPEQLDAILAAFGDTVEGQPSAFELVFRRADGERFPVSVHPANVDLGETSVVIAIVKDLSGEKARDDEFERVRRLVEIMERAGDLAWYTWHLESGRSEVSESYFRILGYEVGSFALGYDEWASRVHPDDLERTLAALQDLLEGRSRSYESEHRLRDASGSWRWMLARGYVDERDEGGRPRTIVGTYQDIHRLRQQEDRLRQFEKMELVGQMAGGVAHDFNNVLTVAQGNLELLRRELGPGGSPRLEDVDRALSRATKLTRSLLEYSRRQEGEVRVVDLGESLRAASRLLASSFPVGLELEWQLDPEPVHAQVDTSRLEHAIMNLALNSRDASSPGGGRITFRTGRRRVGPGEVAELTIGMYGVLTVEDEGSGMPPEVVERAFEPLFTTKPRGKGTGLGLSMVRRFASDSGGAVLLESAPGRGTRVELLLPLVEGAVVEEATGDASPEELPRSRGELIFVVDDEEALARLVHRQLESLGYRVRSWDHPREVLPALGEEEPALLLTDIVMPYEIDGLELARRARLLRPGLPILFTTGYTDEQQDRQRKSFGPVLRKPFDLDALARALRAVLDLPAG